ncbi:M23 family metallopeptidase [Jatrophihabitans sp.]|uniref:M23 family metallopeptidase n=1 Tax=Jatrophihabitans sp. TaxID=1932789 RepID=UPI002EDFD0B9
MPNRAPLWRRSPAVPAAVAVLAVWSTAQVPHLLTAGQAAPASEAAGPSAWAAGEGLGPGSASASWASTSGSQDAGVDATALSAATRLGATDRRVSRQNRTVSLTGAAAGPAAAVRPAAKPAEVAGSHWVRPSAGAESSCFCMRWGRMHDGIDLAGPLGSPIVAVGDGVVVEAGPAAGFGMWVAIRHANGDYSIYGHMYRCYVRVGDHVRAGQHIADIGANGRSTGPHLHFGIAHGKPTGPFIDPVPWLQARGVKVGPYNPDA